MERCKGITRGGSIMRKIITEMLAVAIIAVLISATLWLTEWNAWFGYAYTFALIGITLSIGKKLDR